MKSQTRTEAATRNLIQSIQIMAREYPESVPPETRELLRRHWDERDELDINHADPRPVRETRH